MASEMPEALDEAQPHTSLSIKPEQSPPDSHPPDEVAMRAPPLVHSAVAAFQAPIMVKNNTGSKPSVAQNSSVTIVPTSGSEVNPPPLPKKSTQSSRRHRGPVPQEDLRRNFARPGLFKDVAHQISRTNEFVYSPLQKRDQIRILRVYSGKQKDTIRCRLIPTTTTSIEYEALSYWWGNDQPAQEIKIAKDQSFQDTSHTKSEELKFYIRSNLFTALRSLREEDSDVDLWVDALCINQEDDEEKQKQVAKMEEIYSMASCVLIWLGALGQPVQGMDTSAVAFNFIRVLCNLRQFDSKLTYEYSKQWQALADLMTNNWFSRRWVVQELALAQEAYVHCGDLEPLLWDDFADVISMFVLRFDQIKKFLRNSKPRPEDPDPLREAKKLGPNVLVDATNNLFRRSNENMIVERQKTLETLISTLTAYEASDPRDTIYAVLSIAKDTWRQTHPIVTSRRSSALSMINSSTLEQSAQQVDPESTSGAGANAPDLDAMVSSMEIPRGLRSIGPVGSDISHFHGIRADYEKDLLQVCQEFIKSCVKGSNSLDMICRHWAPDVKLQALSPQDLKRKLTRAEKNWAITRKLPSWMLPLSDGPFGTPKDTLNGRKNGDSLVGLPGQSYYNASNNIRLEQEDYEFKQVPEREHIAKLRAAAKAPAANSSAPAPLANGEADKTTNGVTNGATKETAHKGSETPRMVTDGTMSVKGIRIDAIPKPGLIIVDGMIPEDALLLGGWRAHDHRSNETEDVDYNDLEDLHDSEPKEPVPDIIPDELCRTLVADRGPEGGNAPRWYLRACRHAIALRTLSNTINTEMLIESDRESIMIEFLKRVRDVTWNKMLFRSQKSHPGDKEKRGRLGLAPKTAREGDIICILFGCSVPVILRERDSGGYIFVGECYLHGVMDGEAIPSSKRAHLKEETFVLH